MEIVETVAALISKAQLIDACRQRRAAILRGHTGTIGERMQADLAAFMEQVGRIQPTGGRWWPALPTGRWM